MGFLQNLFSKKNAADLLARGNTHLFAGRHYDARLDFEEGLARHLKNEGGDPTDAIASDFESRIAACSREMALANLTEAGHCLHQGNHLKAREHAELAISLSNTGEIREMAESYLLPVRENTNDTTELETPPPSCSCSGHISGNCSDSDKSEETAEASAEMPLEDYYDLLIHQLPPDMTQRYAAFGEDFAQAYTAAHDARHEEALTLFGEWRCNPQDRDVHLHETGMVLYRMGRVAEAERLLREACEANPGNSLARIFLAQFLMEQGHLEEAASHCDAMLHEKMLPGQALLLRGDVFQLSGDIDAAAGCYSRLLSSPSARTAAERLYVMFDETGREQEAAAVFKQFLAKGCHA